MMWLWIVQGIIDVALILIVVGYRKVFFDVLDAIDTLTKNLKKVKELTEEVERLRKTILGRG